MDHKKNMEILDRVVRHETPFMVEMTMLRAFLIVSSLQLTYAHPEVSEETREEMRRIGEDIQAIITHSFPDAADFLDKGWNPDWLMTRQEFDAATSDDDPFPSSDWDLEL